MIEVTASATKREWVRDACQYATGVSQKAVIWHMGDMLPMVGYKHTLTLLLPQTLGIYQQQQGGGGGLLEALYTLPSLCKCCQIKVIG